MIFHGYVKPGFPLLPGNLLVSNKAVYAGLKIADPDMGTVFMVSSLLFDVSSVLSSKICVVHCPYLRMPTTVGVTNEPLRIFPLPSSVSDQQQWNILYGGSIPVTLYVSADNIIQGYDFWGLDRRTYVITRFFNIEVGQIGSDVFGFPG